MTPRGQLDACEVRPGGVPFPRTAEPTDPPALAGESGRSAQVHPGNLEPRAPDAEAGGSQSIYIAPFPTAVSNRRFQPPFPTDVSRLRRDANTFSFHPFFPSAIFCSGSVAAVSQINKVGVVISP